MDREDVGREWVNAKDRTRPWRDLGGDQEGPGQRPGLTQTGVRVHIGRVVKGPRRVEAVCRLKRRSGRCTSASPGTRGWYGDRGLGGGESIEVSGQAAPVGKTESRQVGGHRVSCLTPTPPQTPPCVTPRPLGVRSRDKEEVCPRDVLSPHGTRPRLLRRHPPTRGVPLPLSPTTTTFCVAPITPLPGPLSPSRSSVYRPLSHESSLSRPRVPTLSPHSLFRWVREAGPPSMKRLQLGLKQGQL